MHGHAKELTQLDINHRTDFLSAMNASYEEFEKPIAYIVRWLRDQKG